MRSVKFDYFDMIFGKIKYDFLCDIMKIFKILIKLIFILNIYILISVIIVNVIKNIMKVKG